MKCWQQVYGGKVTDLADFNSSFVDISTICHTLFRLPRFGGHTDVPFSVGQHSLHCFFLADPFNNDRKKLLSLLLHDAHEVYTSFGDVGTPGKALLRANGSYFLDDLERQIDIAIEEHFGFNFDYNFNKVYDNLALLREVKTLFVSPASLWGDLSQVSVIENVNIYTESLFRLVLEDLDV